MGNLLAVLRLLVLSLAVSIIVPVTPNDLERAISLGRGQHTDAERAQFHTRYIVSVNGPAVDSWSVEQVEVITEFRRLELMAEEHGRLNDLWGRGGTRQVEEDIRPWRGRVSVVVHLRLHPTLTHITGVPTVDLVVSGAPVMTFDVRITPLYGSCAEPPNCALVGGLVEHVLDAASLGQSARSVKVMLGSKEMASVALDFPRLD